MRRDSDTGRCPSPSPHRSQYPPHYPTWVFVQGRLPVHSHSRHTKVYAHKVTDPHTARHTDTRPHRQTGTLHMLIHIWTGLLEHTHSQCTYTDTEKRVFTQTDGHIHLTGTCLPTPNIHTRRHTYRNTDMLLYTQTHTERPSLAGLTWTGTFRYCPPTHIHKHTPSLPHAQTGPL